ncbi:hypothetical protein NQ317_014288 [Molorchus minor]|uniref:Uncharacterized protein n=1 Tax=Molorchus minor TaxID=1323400 RepID=A0ABQ9IQU3_9CUCU|nr:hypothetical protein NQ317_014288 [Molorchus minor]
MQHKITAAYIYLLKTDFSKQTIAYFCLFIEDAEKRTCKKEGQNLEKIQTNTGRKETETTWYTMFNRSDQHEFH